MSTSTQTDPAVAAFAAAVRDALGDLPREEVDELTDGLEADLTDRSLEPDAPALADPGAYADELRLAAGLPPRGPMPRPHRRSFLDEAIANARANLRPLVEHPRGRAALAFLTAIRPAWWVLRGWLAYLLLAAVLGGPHLLPVSPLLAAALVLAIVASVQVGRGRWLARPSLTGLVVVINVVAAIGAPFALGWAYANQNAAQYSYTEPSEPAPLGLTRDGAPITNIFAYGPDGQPLEGVQLFDQDGEPLDLVPDPAADHVWEPSGTFLLVPSEAAPGRSGWNVVPLDRVPTTSLGNDGTLLQSATPRPVELPYRAVQPLAGYVAATDTEE
jgi:hypothetical protein